MFGITFWNLLKGRRHSLLHSLPILYWNTDTMTGALIAILVNEDCHCSSVSQKTWVSEPLVEPLHQPSTSFAWARNLTSVLFKHSSFWFFCYMWCNKYLFIGVLCVLDAHLYYKNGTVSSSLNPLPLFVIVCNFDLKFTFLCLYGFWFYWLFFLLT